jgi:dinuclear metal center YbgI/SA1388 family protein
MTLNDLYEKLSVVIPKELSCSWDNDGIMCLPDGNRNVKKVLLTLDVTEAAVDHAVNNNYDLIVSHHPLIFKPIKSVRDGRMIKLIKNNVAVFSFHTRLDRVDGGVNTALAKMLGLNDLTRFGEDDLGVIGTLENAVTDREFALYVKEKLGAHHVEGIFFDRICKRIALVGGDGDDYIEAAKEAGADMYISGSLGYNDMTDAYAYGISVLSAGHFHTENPVLSALKEMIKDIDPTIDLEIFDCNVIEGL